MFPMMTPLDAISYALRAGMILGQVQTLWLARMIEMQGLWASPEGTVFAPDRPAPAATPPQPKPAARRTGKAAPSAAE